MESSDLTKAQWERLRLVLPPQKPHTSLPGKDHRLILNGILWILRTGRPWRALPERSSSWKAVSCRFCRWQRGRGRPRVRPDAVAADKGYSSLTVRQYLKERRIGVVIPTKIDQASDPAFDRVAYRERTIVERLINRRK